MEDTSKAKTFQTEGEVEPKSTCLSFAILRLLLRILRVTINASKSKTVSEKQLNFFKSLEYSKGRICRWC